MMDGTHRVDIVEVVDGGDERIPGGQVPGAEEKVTPVDAVRQATGILRRGLRFVG